MVFSKSFDLNIVGFLCGAVLITASLLFYPRLLEDKKTLVAPPPHLEFFSFGFQGIIADSLWVRAIQDLDYCEEKLAINKCKNNSWLYHMLDTVTTLSPDLQFVYSDGGVALSVVVSDSEGASKIYAKGIKLYPHDFNLLYRAGLHAWYDEKNNAKAASLYLKAARAQGLEGSWLYSLAARLFTDAGQKEVATKLYYQMKEEGLDDAYLKRMREKLGLPDDQ